MKLKLSIVIPCYNEEKNINKLLNKIENILSKNNFVYIILVNNGSNDKTKHIISNSKLINNENFFLCNISTNIGYGHGISTGLKNIKTKYFSWTHADLQTDLNDVVFAFNKYENDLKNGKHIVKGSRINRNLFDKFFTFLMSIIVSIFTLQKLTDINAQPKIFNKDLYLKLKNPPDDFMLDLYLMIIAKKNKYRVLNYPVYFNKRNHGVAKGGGSLKGKIRLSLNTLKYIIFNKWK